MKKLFIWISVPLVYIASYVAVLLISALVLFIAGFFIIEEENYSFLWVYIFQGIAAYSAIMWTVEYSPNNKRMVGYIFVAITSILLIADLVYSFISIGFSLHHIARTISALIGVGIALVKIKSGDYKAFNK